MGRRQVKRPRLGGLDIRTAAELRDWLSSDDGREAMARAAWSRLASDQRRADAAARAAALRDELREQAGRERWRRAAGIPSPDSPATPDPRQADAAAAARGAAASPSGPIARPGASDVSGMQSEVRARNSGCEGPSATGAGGAAAPLDTDRDTLAAVPGGRR